MRQQSTVTAETLTQAEADILSALPRPPVKGRIQCSHVWIMEWLRPSDVATGLTLHEWLLKRRPGWSRYTHCNSGSALIAAIDKATTEAQARGAKPVLHIETHGSTMGLAGPDGHGGEELLSWDQLIAPLQRLNLATRCNLLVFVAACIGFAGVQALVRGPRAPAVALVGPDAIITERQILDASKEFYRRLVDDQPELHAMAASASREAEPVGIECEPFVLLAYEAMVEQLIVSMRPTNRNARLDRLRTRLLDETSLSSSAIDERMAHFPKVIPKLAQSVWNEMFMMDLYPETRDRFGLDIHMIANVIDMKLAGT